MATTHNLLTAESHARAILQNAVAAVAFNPPNLIGSQLSSTDRLSPAGCIDSLHNAVHYLLTGRIDGRRGVASLLRTELLR